MNQSEFGKVTGYELNTQKSVAFLYIKNEQSKQKLGEKFHLEYHQKDEIVRN